MSATPRRTIVRPWACSGKPAYDPCSCMNHVIVIVCGPFGNHGTLAVRLSSVETEGTIAMKHVLRKYTGSLALMFLLVCAGSGAQGLTFKFKTYDVSNAIQTWLTSISNDGTIVGWFVDQQGNAHGFTLVNGNFQQIDDGPQTEIWGINRKGDLVGSYYDGCIEEVCEEGFRYHNGVFSDIGPKWFTTPPEDDSPDTQAFG